MPDPASMSTGKSAKTVVQAEPQPSYLDLRTVKAARQEYDEIVRFAIQDREVDVQYAQIIADKA